MTNMIFCHLGPFFALSAPWQPTKSKFWKKNIKKKHTHTHEDIIILQICTINDSHIYVCIVPEIWSAMDRIFFVILDCLLSFYLPNNLKNQNFEKMKKTPGDIIILHMCTINDNHMMYGSWDMEHVTDRIFCHFGLFFALLPL